MWLLEMRPDASKNNVHRNREEVNTSSNTLYELFCLGLYDAWASDADTVPKRREPMTQWRSVRSQKNGDI